MLECGVTKYIKISKIYLLVLKLSFCNTTDTNHRGYLGVYGTRCLRSDELVVEKRWKPFL